VTVQPGIAHHKLDAGVGQELFDFDEHAMRLVGLVPAREDDNSHH
jgi:hypothetical protein